MIRTLAAALATTTCLVAFASPATAQTREFNIPAGSLRTALDAFARQTGRQVIYRGDEVGSKRSPGVRGAHTAEEALDAILAGTGFKAQKDSSGAFAVAKVGNGPTIANSAAPPPAGDASSEDIVVTGTNIRGGSPVGSPLVTISRADIERSGYSSTDQLLQALPQTNRGGPEGASADSTLGVNPATIDNFTRGTGVNLRGLGAGATLTLINGHRVAPSGGGTFTDISLIPLSAIERIEILSDGASAIYGADAVAGVVNVILRKDYSGAESTLRYGTTAPSGRTELRASQTAGANWGTGNGILTVDYLRQSELSSDERPFTADVPRPTSVLPSNKTISALASVRQSFSDVTAQFDAQYAHANRRLEYSTGDGLTINFPARTDRLNAALAVTKPLSSRWDATITGLFSNELSHADNLYMTPGDPNPGAGSALRRFNQDQWAVNGTVRGTLFDLPAGPFSLATGVDARWETFKLRQTDVESSDVVSSGTRRNVLSLFGELRLPIFSPQNSLPGLYRLSLSAAGRYDRYSDFGSTFNPKVGISWSPIAQLSLRSSFSTSFRAPPSGILLSTSESGTDPAVALFSFQSPSSGLSIPVATITGSRLLKAEKARNWTVGLDWEPSIVPDLKIQLTYYDIKFRNRIVQPPFDLGVLSNPALSSYVTNYSSPAALQTAIANLTKVSPTYLDFTGPDFNGGEFGSDPQNLTTTLYDLRYTNAGVVLTNGIDFSAQYKIAAGRGSVILSAAATYIFRIDTQFSSPAPFIDLAGTAGNPARFKSRATATYSVRDLDTTVAFNYIGRYTDTSGVVDRPVASYPTVDINLRYRFSSNSKAALSGLSAALSITNAFNRRPPYVEAAGRGAHYDTANADPLGRIIALEVTKEW